MAVAAEDRPVAVVAALPEELRPLRRRLRDPANRTLGSYRAVAGRLGDTGVVVLATGDGALRARAGLGKLLDSLEAEAVIAIGVAGGLSPDLANWSGEPTGSMGSGQERC
jgi:nucleoside phosphorylase